MGKWILYGAYGATGRMIAAEAVKRGHRPLLAGRDRSKLSAMASELGLDMLAAEADGSEALAEAVAESDLLLNAAGPFTKTSRPIIQACLQGRTHYLDICGEHYVLEDVFAFDPLAREAGTAVIPGVGFDVLPTDCLASYLTQQLSPAEELEMGIAGLGQPTTGTVFTSLEIFSRGCFLRKNGVLETCRFGRENKEILFSHGKRWTAVMAPWADLATAYRTTNIPNIKVYFALHPRLLRFAGTGTSIARRLFSSELVRKASKGLVKYLLARQDEEGRLREKSYLWARVTDKQGRQAEAWMETGDSYLFTAAASVRSVEECLSNEIEGVLTPAQAFGPDFVLEIEGVKRIDSLPGDSRQAE